MRPKIDTKYHPYLYVKNKMCNIKVLTLQLTINCKMSKIYYCEFIIIRGILIFVDFVYIAKARIWEFNEYVFP